MVRCFLLFMTLAAAAAETPFPINPNGGWCWFQDERAIVFDNKVAVASISREGDVQVTTWNLAKGSLDITTLRANFMRDDHNVAALLLRHDGRLMVFYAQHHQEPRMYYRITTRPRDTSGWGPERSLNAGLSDKFTYPNPFQLSAEDNRVYLFWRGKDFNPTWSASDNGGLTWSPGANHIYFRKGERPYVKYTSNHKDTIHFAFTEAHPNRPFPTSLYHSYYRSGGLYRSDGQLVRKLADGPITPPEATKVYDGANSPAGEAWVWDMVLDSSGRPVIVYSTHLSPEDHRYRYARWNGRTWEDRQIAFAGSRLYEREAFYSGGICLDPDNPGVAYLSSNVDIHTGKPNASGRYEIYKGVSRDQGRDWHWQTLTMNSTHDNLRPIVPAGHPRGAFVLWLRGTYRAYTDYETEVVALTDARLPNPKKLSDARR